MFEHPKFCVWSGHRVLIRTVCLVLQDRFRKQSGFPSSVAFCYSAQVAVSSCESCLDDSFTGIHQLEAINQRSKKMTKGEKGKKKNTT